MRHACVLIAALSATLLFMASTVIFVCGSERQLARRVARVWSHGILKIERAELKGLHTVQAQKVRLSAQRKRLLVLNDVEWSHGGLWSGDRAAGWHTREVRFESGELDLEFDITPIAVTTATPESARFDWIADLPARIAGNRLNLTAKSAAKPRKAVITGVELRSPELRRDGNAAQFFAEVQSTARPRPLWGRGELRGTLAAPDAMEFSLQFEDADLAGFEFAELRALFDLPWPADLAQLAGRANLRWERTPDRSRIVLQHVQTSFAVPGLSQLPRALAGSAECDRQLVKWRIESGIYSRSRVQGELEIDIPSRRTRGQVYLREFLDDRGLALGLPRVWHGLREQFPLSGQGEMEIVVDGILGGDLWKLVKQIRFHLEDVSGGAGARFAPLALEFALSRQDAMWVLAGKMDAIEYRGIRIEPGTWSGYLDGKFLLLERACGPEEGTRLEVDVNDHALAFRIALDKLSLSSLLTFPCGEALGTLAVTGAWSPMGSIEWQALLNFDGFTTPEDAPWPMRPPQGPLQGDICIRCTNDVLTFPWIRVRDAAGTWLAIGGVNREGEWDLSGVSLPGTRRFPLPMDVAQRIAHAPQDAVPFRINGRFFEWRIQ